MSHRRYPISTIVNGVARVPWPAQTPEQRQFVFDHSGYLWPESAEAAERRRERDRQAEANSAVRAWMSRRLDEISPIRLRVGENLIIGQAPDTEIEDHYKVIRKTAAGMALVKLEAGDVELAEKISREEDLPFEECLKAVIKVNRLATPSYLGGDQIRKEGDRTMKKKERTLVSGKAEGGTTKSGGWRGFA